MAGLIDARVARSVARRLAGDASLRGSSEALDRLVADLDDAVPRAEQLVADASGIPAPGRVQWGVIDRATWAETNVTGMVNLLEPLTRKVEQRLHSVPMPARVAQRMLLSVEVGALLGYMSRRVLGQYDLIFTSSGRTRRRALFRSGAKANLDEGAVYFVGPNMLDTQRRLGFVPAEFALWVALHEITHRFQFAGVPWLKEHFVSLVHSYLGSIDMDAKSMAGRFAGGVRRLISGQVPPDERNPAYLLATDEQRHILNQVQALMAVVEGHGNFVMDSVGVRVIPSFARMRHLFEARRKQTSALQKAINHAIGLEMKLRQYELGQAFCNAVVAQRGFGALNELWRGPSSLPTLDELRDPGRWLKRVPA